MAQEIVNRVEQSGLIQINLDEFYPQGDRVVFDIAEYLKDGFILIEKQFREALKEVDWKTFDDKYVAILCSSDAIIPLWAYMLIDSYLQSHAKVSVLGDKIDLEKAIFNEIFLSHDFNKYKDKSVIVKGCGKHPIPESVFVDFTHKLHKVAKTIMFGEACSAVPLYKKSKN